MATTHETVLRDSKSMPGMGILALWISATEEAEFWRSRPLACPLWDSGIDDDQLTRWLNNLCGTLGSKIGPGEERIEEWFTYIFQNVCTLPTSSLFCDGVKTLWGTRLTSSWGINTYRQFLKRMLVGSPSKRSWENLVSMQHAHNTEQRHAMVALQPFIKRVPFTMRDALNITFNASYTFGPGATSDRPAATEFQPLLPTTLSNGYNPREWDPVLRKAQESIYRESKKHRSQQDPLALMNGKCNTSLYHLLMIDMANDVAHACFVPKDWKGYRLITPHPGRAVLYQSQIDAAFLTALEQWRYFPVRDVVAAHAPYTNREKVFYLAGRMAQLPNRTRCNIFYDTLDLSQASDSVTVVHCSQCLDREWFRRFYESRITDLRCSDKDATTPTLLLSQTMFPMGAKACFRVETCVFDTYVRAILSYEGAPPWVIQDARIFGDDIVVPHPWGSIVAEWLNKLGFTVNLDKSYVQGSYRETCGVETDFSLDITPVRIPRGANVRWLAEADQSTLVDFARTLDSNGLYKTQALFIELCNEIAYRRLPRKSGSNQIDWKRASRVRNFPIYTTDDPGQSANGWVSSPFNDEIIEECVYSPLLSPVPRTYNIRRYSSESEHELALQLLELRCGLDERFARIVLDYMISQVKGSYTPGKEPSRSSLLPVEHTRRVSKVRVLREWADTYSKRQQAVSDGVHFPRLLLRVALRKPKGS